MLTAVAEGVGGGGGGGGGGTIGEEGFKAVYWACVGLCGVGLVVSVFAIEVPEGLRGSVWKKEKKEGGGSAQPVVGSAEVAPGVEGTTGGASSVASSSHELQPVVRETRED